MKRLAIVLGVCVLTSCSVEKKFAKVADKQVLSEQALQTAHIGISIFDADKQEYIYEHQGNKFFIPASNTKLMTCYAAMKLLGDSITTANIAEESDGVYILPAGDPTFLHPDYKQQPLLDFIKKQTKPVYLQPEFWQEKSFGFGWAWDDYESDYMAERSIMPLYGNVVTISGKKDSLTTFPAYFNVALNGNEYINDISRTRSANIFTAAARGKQARSISIPFVTSDSLTASLLSFAAGKQISLGKTPFSHVVKMSTVSSVHIDSLLTPMMHRSDNFFAEQTLLMISQKKLFVMNDAKIIDTLLKTVYADLPQKPKWVDGSGLSRYNLISPEDFVTVLNKMNREFDWKRIETILPTGGEGTLSSYYKKYAGKIYAKTGTLSNNIALSGFLLTDSGKKLIFSVLVNNHQAPTATIRKGVENMLGWLIENY